MKYKSEEFDFFIFVHERMELFVPGSMLTGNKKRRILYMQLCKE